MTTETCARCEGSGLVFPDSPERPGYLLAEDCTGCKGLGTTCRTIATPASPAGTIGRAASLMRERAEAAICSCGGPACTLDNGGIRRGEMAARFDDWPRVVDHYAALTPPFVVAVADWLAAEARTSGDVGSALDAALVVARAYLGEA